MEGWWHPPKHKYSTRCGLDNIVLLTQAAHVSSILEAIIKQAMMQEKKRLRPMKPLGQFLIQVLSSRWGAENVWYRWNNCQLVSAAAFVHVQFDQLRKIGRLAGPNSNFSSQIPVVSPVPRN